MDDIFEKVKGIVIERLGVSVEEVTSESSFKEDLGADSLDIVELVMELEDEFDIKISEEHAESIQTVGEAVKLIASIQ